MSAGFEQTNGMETAYEARETPASAARRPGKTKAAGPLGPAASLEGQ